MICRQDYSGRLHLSVRCGQGKVETRSLKERCLRNAEENVLEEFSIYVDTDSQRIMTGSLFKSTYSDPAGKSSRSEGKRSWD